MLLEASSTLQRFRAADTDSLLQQTSKALDGGDAEVAQGKDRR